MPKALPLFIGIILGTAFFGCAHKKETVFTGKAMGSAYHIKVVGVYFDNAESLGPAIDRRLEELNQCISTYRPESEISRFNRFSALDPFPISDDFVRILETAWPLYDQTGGAWDPTVAPLVALWGFDAKDGAGRIPDQADIDRCREQIGFTELILQERRYLRKKRADLSLDLNSVGQGFGVDQVAEVIRKAGFHDFLVEIGGEVLASGSRADGTDWRVGVNKPVQGSPFDQIYKIVALHDQAMSTSGDYRNFFIKEGKTYSHIIDPRNGRPVSNGVVSVSITAPSCTYADGLATAVMVLGTSEGLALINKLPGVEGMIIERDENGRLRDYYSEGFKALLLDPK